MESADENRLAKDVAVHRIHHSSTSIGSLLWCTLRYFQFRIERIEFECVVMVRTRTRTRSHVSVSTKADLSAAVGQFALSNTFGQTG